MIQLRPHRGSFEESLKQTLFIQDADDVLAYLLCYYPELHARPEDLGQRYFGLDTRCGWNSWIITVRGASVLWSDGPIPNLSRDSAVETESA